MLGCLVCWSSVLVPTHHLGLRGLRSSPRVYLAGKCCAGGHGTITSSKRSIDPSSGPGCDSLACATDQSALPAQVSTRQDPSAITKKLVKKLCLWQKLKADMYASLLQGTEGLSKPGTVVTVMLSSALNSHNRTLLPQSPISIPWRP